jgi:geranylgeranyl diphosphate synthase type I
VVLAARELADVQDEVVSGQMLDVHGGAHEMEQVEAVHALKTASYTVRGPVVIGARLAGASEPLVLALRAFAEPLGVAFQLRDDVLGIFGNTREMGKPSGSDLRQGKRTAPVVFAMRSPPAAGRLERVLGRADASDEDIALAVRSIEESGARARVDQRISELVAVALAALDRVEVVERGRALLAQAAVLLTRRER